MAVSEELVSVFLSTPGDRVSTGEDRLPALDGVRAIAIALVLIGHTMLAAGALYSWGVLFGNAGVSVFFVLSGFLVTRVMLLDENRAGRLRLGRFYRRRAFRIFPAFYAFLGSLCVLSALGLVLGPTRGEWISSAFYFRNLISGGWDTGHLWSLALEEQFYLFWPVLFLLLANKRRRLLFIAVAVIASTVVRAYWLLHHPGVSLDYAIPAMEWWPHMRMDTFLIGAAFSIGEFSWVRSVPIRFLFPVLAFWYKNALFVRWMLPLYTPVVAFCVGLMILWLVQNPGLRPSRNFARPSVVYVGVISYSIYLWQQLFLGPHLHWWSLPAAGACALGSYYLIEKPALAWKDKLESATWLRFRSRTLAAAR